MIPPGTKRSAKVRRVTLSETKPNQVKSNRAGDITGGYYKTCYQHFTIFNVRVAQRPYDGTRPPQTSSNNFTAQVTGSWGSVDIATVLMSRSTKPAQKLASPYSDLPWPSVSPGVEESAVGLLELVLVPIGEYRRAQSKLPSVRHRPKRRGGNPEVNDNSAPETALPPIHSHLTIGFNSTVKSLESLVRTRCPGPKSGTPGLPPAILAIVFVCRSKLPSIMTSSLPVLVAAASLALPREQSIRLVSLSEGASIRLAQTLDQPRVGVIGVRGDAPATRELIEYVRAKIDCVDVPWLREDKHPSYLPVNVLVEEIANPANSRRKRRRKNESALG